MIGITKSDMVIGIYYFQRFIVFWITKYRLISTYLVMIVIFMIVLWLFDLSD